MCISDFSSLLQASWVPDLMIAKILRWLTDILLQDLDRERAPLEADAQTANRSRDYC